MSKIIPLKTAAKRLLTDVLDVQKDETICIVTDFSEAVNIGRAISKTAENLCAGVVMVSFRPTKENPKMPRNVKFCMKNSDCIILISKASLTFSPDVEEVLSDGKRVVSCPRVTTNMFRRALSVDVSILSKNTKRVVNFLNSAKEAVVSTGSKSELFLKLDSRAAVYVDGIAKDPSSMTIIPGGIVGIAPFEGSASGEIVMSGSISHLGIIKRHIKIIVDNGEIVDILGGSEAKRLEKLLGKYDDDNMYKIAELGVGVHPMMRIRGNATEDESSRGTIVIGLGDNLGHLGGSIKAPDHIDLFIKRGTLLLDYIPLVLNGSLLLADLLPALKGETPSPQVR